jgi:hypothetical protein
MANKITWNTSNIIVRFEGVVTAEEIMGIDNLIYGDPRFDSMNYQIFDYSRVEKMALSEADTEIIGTLDKTASVWNRHVKIAIISGSDFVGKLTQTYKKALSNTSWEVRIFTNINDALRWCEDE